MGWSNLVSIFHGHVTFVLQDDIDITPSFSTTFQYQQEDATYEMIPENSGI